MHSGADRSGVGMVELFQNCQCTLPGEPGRAGIPKSLVDPAKRSESVCLVVTITALTVQINCLLVTTYALPLLAQVEMRVAQAVRCLGLANEVPDFPLQVQGLPAANERMLIVAEMRVKPAHGVKAPRLSGAVPGGPVELKGLLRVLQRLRVAAPSLEHGSEFPAGFGLAGTVTQLPEQVQRVLKVGVRVVIAAQTDECRTQELQGKCLGRLVGHPARSSDRGALTRLQVPPVPAVSEI